MIDTRKEFEAWAEIRKDIFAWRSRIGDSYTSALMANAWVVWQEQERRHAEQDPPWQYLVNEERDGVWAGYSAYEKWLKAQMPDYAAEGYEEADDDGAWKENLYAIVADVFGIQDGVAESANEGFEASQ